MKQLNEPDIEQLNTFLRGELAAVETYDQCIKKVTDPAVVSQLQVLRTSHIRRVQRLAGRVASLGGHPETSSGTWGKVAQAVEGGAKIIGEKVALATLEEGEDYGINLYERGMKSLSPSERAFVEEDLLPEQKRSHNILREIERQFL